MASSEGGDETGKAEQSVEVKSKDAVEEDEEERDMWPAVHRVHEERTLSSRNAFEIFMLCDNLGHHIIIL